MAADVITNPSSGPTVATINATTTVQTIGKDAGPGALLNIGTETVYIGISASTISVAAAVVGSIPIYPSLSVQLPPGCTFFALGTTRGTSTVLYAPGINPFQYVPVQDV